MTEEQNNRYKEVLLQTMKAFIAFCKEQKLPIMRVEVLPLEQ